MNSIFVLAFVSLLSIQPMGNNVASLPTENKKVVEISVEAVAVKAFDAYSKKDLKGFINLFAEDAEVSMFPNKLLFKGRTEIEKSYGTFFEKTANLETELLNRTINQNRVIDEMLVQRVKGQKSDKVTVLYEVKNGLIVKMCFL